MPTNELAPYAELLAEEPALADYIQEYLNGTPLKVLEIRLKGALGSSLSTRFVSAMRKEHGGAAAPAMHSALEGSLGERHGLLGDPSWSAARLAAKAEDLARPGYDSVMAHEYLDTREVLQEKARMLAGLLRQARRAVIYAGAGLSTASGVGDYATRTVGKSVASASSVSTGFMSPYDATPNLGHRVIAALASAGFLWRVVQQNHDGLLQKAGVPQQLINEIHGSWFDPGNPVLKFDEYLREDLNGDLEVVKSNADLVIVLGSSLAGMSADRIVSSCARRAINEEEGILGTVIVSIQRTPQDATSSLRIFATIDSMMELLAAELSLEVAPVQDSAVPELHNALANEVDVYSVPYDSDGNLLEDGSQQFLDLREGAELTVTVGNDKGQRAIVVGKHPEGHFKLNVKRSDTYGGVVAVRYFGKWWVRAALLGQLQHIPLSTSVKPTS